MDLTKMLMDQMSGHNVEVILPGTSYCERLALIEVSVKATWTEMIEMTYGDQLDKLHRGMLDKLTNKEPRDFALGVFVRCNGGSGNRQIVFSFSRDLADYDNLSKTVKLKDLDAIIIAIADMRVKINEQMKNQGLAKKHPSGSGLLLRYAVAEKRS
jgi:hypothetical protein